MILPAALVLISPSFVMHEKDDSSQSFDYQLKVEQLADKWILENQLPGVWCALIKDGKVVARVAKGYRNAQTKDLASVDDKLAIGSISKVISGHLIAELIGKHQITYSTTVGDVFKDLSKDFPNSQLWRCTLLQLMTHRSGLPKDINGLGFDEKTITSRYELIRSLAKLELGFLATTKKYEYSNLGPAIAVAMVEKIAKLDFDQYTKSDAAKRVLNISDIATLGDDRKVFPHRLSETGRLIPNTNEGRASIFNPVGGYMLDLNSICSFSLGLIRNASQLPANVYNSIVKFPTYNDAFPKHTASGWGGSDTQYLWHSGSLGRGDRAELWISVRSKSALFFYSNINLKSNNVDAKLTPESVSRDLRSLRAD